MRPMLNKVAGSILCAMVFGSCALAVSLSAAGAQTGDWRTYRRDIMRTGSQPAASNLSDPVKVGTLHKIWAFPPDGQPAAGNFTASPIVGNGMVFIGSRSGYFYALSAATGQLLWQYPKASDPPLLGSCGAFGRYGISSSAAYASINGQDAVIFGAPDPSAEGGLGSARLFALSLSGNLLGTSDVVAHVSGCTPGTPAHQSLDEHHERITNSAPLVLGNKVYVGISDSADNPIQNGRIIAVDLNTGLINSNFHFAATGARGGGVWNSPATDGSAVYFTTGNTHCDNSGCQSPEPNPDYGLSLIGVDKDTGNILGAFQPVPYTLDDDDDWGAGATVMSTSCGELVASVMKDGWSYAVNVSGLPSARWQFPPTGFPFDPNGPRTHGDTAYYRPGAAWNDVLIITTGGESLVSDGVTPGYSKLHALNACATNEKDFVRWIADIPNTSGNGRSLGTPTVTGGIVFIGTDQGHLVVLGDPSVVPAAGFRCSNIDYTTQPACLGAGYAIVPIPKVLANVALPDGGYTFGLFRNEPALAYGGVFLGTPNGHVYLLAP